MSYVQRTKKEDAYKIFTFGKSLPFMSYVQRTKKEDAYHPSGNR